MTSLIGDGGNQALGGGGLLGRGVSAFRPDNVAPIALVSLVGIMIFPLPSVVLDLLLAISIGLSLVVFILTLNIERPLDLSAFPSILLVLTLLRLSLNIASTRLILSKGHEGPGAVSQVITAFSDFVVGGNYLIGVIIFLILVIINFVVITKGSGRIAEVSARFMLDAMPGKQMSIDADLSAGLISEADARQRREDVQNESAFFGAMDGASKFVKGDAIAGIVITVINIIGGLLVGVAQNDLTFGDAATTYTELTIGDGLAAQLPSLLLSVAAGILVSRAADQDSLGNTLAKQIFGNSKVLAMAAVFLAVTGLIPGMPTFAFGILGLGLGTVAYFGRGEKVVKQEPTEPPLSRSEEERAEIEQSLPVDLLEVEVGYELVPLVDEALEGSILTRISAIRKQIATDLGVVVPPIHMRDNLQLRPGEYSFLLSGAELGRGELRVR